ncbi:MAG: outer membrane lipid asymmetry maintenance protein MlaD [Proteobacteria bacterium]|nr:outer membrane lipid asymmetry maintenance protein MlaD [Pseudomonadota bacterium]MBU1388513.1 outer membrane lipid asymmetry maintenance protein MlaD [Pseudomonadota bacterium]MBU1544810.1 outer membrane lipid asymmetry maintenance protein MlaD [Pseudomonadota bacterium]MBU2481063.1 outer membrane lipid asymmetry maintenance protein MlaD [Pseudomonadota bacterium]
MDKRKIEFYVGLFVIIGVLCAGYLFIVLGEINLFGQKRYPLHAYFASVSGLKANARIEMSGVEIGIVSDISIDKERLMAKVSLRINNDIELTDDSIASIRTSGIIGQKFINISSGGSDTFLKPGDEIEQTESSLDIEALIREYIFSTDSN